MRGFHSHMRGGMHNAVQQEPTGWSIRSLLLGQVLVVLFPLSVLGWFLQINYADAQRRTIEAERVDVVANLVHIVDREVASIISALQAIAATSAVLGDNLENFRPHAAAAAWLKSLNAINLTERSGRQLFSTAVPAGQPIPPRLDMTALLPAFDGQVVISDYTTGLITKVPIFFVTVPVRYPDGSIPYVLSAGFRLDRLAGIFAEAYLPTHWIAGVLDRKGVILTRSIGTDTFVGTSARPEVVNIAVSSEQSGHFTNTTLENIAVTNAFRRSSLTGWIAVVAVPTSIMNAPMQRSLAFLMLTIFATLASSLCLALYVAHRIAEPVRSLSGAAKALALGERPLRHPYLIAELADVWAAFDMAHQRNLERLRVQAELDEKIEWERQHSQELERIQAKLRDSEAGYRSAMSLGRMGSWVTNFQSKTRLWTDEGMALFGLQLPGGRGHVGGPDDEFLTALHPDDKHVMAEFHRLIEQQDEIDAEYRIVRNGEDVWLAGRGRAATRGPCGKAIEMINIVSDITRRKAAEDQVKLLLGETAHRTKNLLTVVQAIASHTARSARSVTDFRDAFIKRLAGLAASLDLLTKGNWVGVELQDLIQQQLAPFADHPHRSLRGPRLFLSPPAAQSIGMALHELATNATKYGALSVATGRIELSWQLVSDSTDRRVVLQWVEKGGPTVVPPTHKGFGSAVVDRMMTEGINGKVTVDFRPDGLIWTVEFPVVHLVKHVDPKLDVASTLLEKV